MARAAARMPTTPGAAFMAAPLVGEEDEPLPVADALPDEVPDAELEAPLPKTPPTASLTLGALLPLAALALPMKSDAV